MTKFKPIGFFLTLIISGALYAVTMCRSVEFIDSGELALACKYLGIAHPTGYPLYTLIGRIFAMIPISDLIIRLNFLSLLFTCAASGFLYLILHESAISNRVDAFEGLISSISCSLTVSFGSVWWAQATTNEVYALNLLLITISLWGLFRYMLNELKQLRFLLLSAYTMGLALTNHLSAIYLLPGYLFIIIYLLYKKTIGYKTVFLSAGLILFAGTIYLIMPIRASFRPFLNWGGITDWMSFWAHVTAWQYRLWMFSEVEKMPQKLMEAFALFRGQFNYAAIILIIVGIYRGVKNQKVITSFLVFVIAFNLVYALNYQIVDIDAYYLPLYISTAIFMSIGLIYAISNIKSKIKSRGLRMLLILILCAFFSLFNLMANFRKSDKSHKYYAVQAATDIVRSMESGGMAILENWDFYSPWLYLRFEEGFAKETVLLDKELMRRSWYMDFIKRNHPEIYERSEESIEKFLKEVRPFEENRQFNPEIIDKAYYGMFRAIIINESKYRAVYTNVLSDQKFAVLQELTPDGILYRFHDPRQYLQRPEFVFDEKGWSSSDVFRDFRVKSVLSYYRRAFSAREQYCRYFGKVSEMEYYKRLAIRVNGLMEIAK